MARLLIEGFGDVDQAIAYGNWLSKREATIRTPNLIGTVSVPAPSYGTVTYDGDVTIAANVVEVYPTKVKE